MLKHRKDIRIGGEDERQKDMGTVLEEPSKEASQEPMQAGAVKVEVIFTNLLTHSRVLHQTLILKVSMTHVFQS